MKGSLRSVTRALAVGFAVYFAARAVWWTEQPTAPLLMVGAITLYLVVLVAVVVIEVPGTVKFPAIWGIVTVGASVVIPLMVTASLRPEEYTAPFATWFIGAIGLLAMICIVRRRAVTGWLVLAVLITETTLMLGFVPALQFGLVGSITWSLLAQLLVLFWGRAVRDTEHLAEIQRAVSAWHATQLVRQRERRVRVKYALALAGPVLTKTVASQGRLTDAERLDARLAEGRLRDELRGASLLNDAVRRAIQDVRLRGVSVTVFDEGGLDGIAEERRDEIRDELAAVVSGADAERVIIRAARDELIAVTVVGRTVAGDSSDEDAVGLWHEIPRDR